MSAADIRLLVERCYDPTVYSGVIAHVGNPLDGLNPNVQATSSQGPVSSDPSPGENIRNIVGRCYSVPVLNNPNPLDQTNPPPEPSDPPVLDPELPGKIIRTLVGRCYGPPPPPYIDPPDLPPPDLTTHIDIPPWVPWIVEITGCPHPPTQITLKPPPPGKMTWITIVTDDPNDCELVAAFLEKDEVKHLPDYSQDGKGPPGWWEHKETGKKYYCDTNIRENPDWDKCVKNALDCLFRPYFGGMWQPPKTDCDAYWPNGWSGNQTEVCVKNCFPNRIPIYESYMSTGTLAVTFDATGQLVATGSGTVDVILKLQWNDRPWTYGTAIDSIDVGGKTFTRVGRSGEQIETITLTTAGTTAVAFTGLHSANSTLLIKDNGTRICMLDGHGSDCNANFSIVSTSAAADHAYYSTGAKAGYVLTNTSPAFYILRDPIPGKSVPLFRFYSSLKQDTFLTTNPGMPDSPGVGERPSMNSVGMAGGELIGHVFPDAASMNSYLAQNEKAQAIHRFHSSDPFDHKYKIDGPTDPVKLVENEYRIPTEVKTDLMVQIDVEKGSSSYDSSLGFYLADETGPKYGRIVCTNAKGGTELYTAYLPSAKLNEYAGGTMGFFMMPNGGNLNSQAINDVISFEALNTGGNGPGFRGVGVNTAQQNYIFFSGRKWNPQNNKDYTKWQGANTQMWEDLLDGDDDYNDVRLWHKVGWSYDGFMYEGIQCYAYAGPAPEKVMRTIDPKVKCDSRILQASFKDIILRRMDCGTKIPAMHNQDVEWECGECVDDNTWYVNPATLAWRITSGSSTTNVTATFDASGNLVVGGTGSATIDFSFSWNDNPGKYGTALGTYAITPLGISFTQTAGVQTGSLPNQTATITAGQTYNCTITNGNAAGFTRTNGDQTLCFKDSDGTDCNATLSIAGITQGVIETEVTNSATEKGSWAQVGASNNPGSPWTQHMIDYGIYPSVPADTVVDPHIDTWQTHTATFTSAGGDHNLRIESDNYGYVKLTAPNGSVILDREIDYDHGMGSELLGLRQLSVGTYTLETRVKNLNLGKYAVELNRYQTIKAAVGGTFRFVSMGGITGGLFGNCIKFTIRVLKNNVELFTKQFEAQYFPLIGQDLWDGDITLSPGDATATPVVEPDELTFELVSIDTGPVIGDISLEVAMYNTETTKFDGNFKLMLGTQSHDGVIAGGMGNPTNNPEKAEGGEVEGFAMSFNPTNRQDYEWEPGGKKGDTIPNPPAWQDTNYSNGTRVLGGANIYESTADIESDGTATVPTHTSGITDSWKFIRVAPYPTWVESNVPDPGYPYTYTWTGNNPVWMHGSLQDQPDIPGRSRTRNNPLMPNIPGGYSDTGYLYESDDPENVYFSATILPSYNYRNLSGCYNHLLESYLFTRLETFSGTNISAAQKLLLAEGIPTTFARNSKPWYVMGGDNANNKWYVNPACIAWRITEGSTQIATSVTEKGDWVQINEPNNPGNGWTQHMIDYGIYKVKPLDTQIDPYIGEWQTHTATVTFPSSATYSIRIESDNWGWLKITNPSSVVIYDAEITYTAGAGGQTIPLTLAAGDYIIETRVKNRSVQGGAYQDAVNTIWNGSQQAPQRDTYFSPITFIQDYTLDNYHGTGGSSYADACKIRVGITFYPVIFDETTASKQVHYWQAMINIMSVVNKGKGYAKGSEFVLTWPPLRGNKSTEDPAQTPYYPDQETGFSIPAGKQLAWWENEDLVRRSLKEAFYQESHNKDSIVWYSSTDKSKFRVRFKVTLTSVTDPP